MLLETTTRSSLADLLDDLVNAGATYGYFTLCDDATVLATVTCADPAFGSASSGVITLASVPLAFVGSGAGTCDRAKFYDSDNTLRFTLSAGGTGSGNEVILDNPVIAVSQNGSVTSLTITVPAGSID